MSLILFLFTFSNYSGCSSRVRDPAASHGLAEGRRWLPYLDVGNGNIGFVESCSVDCVSILDWKRKTIGPVIRNVRKKSDACVWHDVGCKFLMNPFSILIMDDVPYFRSSIVNELSRRFDVKMIYEAGNAPAAINLILKHQPAIIVLDIKVPGGIFDEINYNSGIDVLHFAKSKLPDSIVFMLSNHANEYYRRECTKAGANFFFDKTTEFDSFLDTIQYLLNKTW